MPILECNILFFSQGTYIVTDTIYLPMESWSAISANGSHFCNPKSPRPMIKVGNAGDVGVAQFLDMPFTIKEVLQGCTLVKVNMAGKSLGDVGFWNSHSLVGGMPLFHGSYQHGPHFMAHRCSRLRCPNKLRRKSFILHGYLLTHAAHIFIDLLRDHVGLDSRPRPQRETQRRARTDDIHWSRHAHRSHNRDMGPRHRKRAQHTLPIKLPWGT